MTNLDTDLLKPSDLAHYLCVSRSWVYEAAKAGRIPCVRLGGPDGPVRFFRGDVERWLENARREWLPGNLPRAPGVERPGRWRRRARSCCWTGSPTMQVAADYAASAITLLADVERADQASVCSAARLTNDASKCP